MLYSFIEQTLQPGPAVSLKCSAAGNPTPQVHWTLDGFSLPSNGRYVNRENKKKIEYKPKSSFSPNFTICFEFYNFICIYQSFDLIILLFAFVYVIRRLTPCLVYYYAIELNSI